MACRFSSRSIVTGCTFRADEPCGSDNAGQLTVLASRDRTAQPRFAWRFEKIEPATRHLASEVLCDVSSQLQNTTGLIQRLARLYPHYGQAELLRMALLITLHPSDRASHGGAFDSACEQESISRAAVTPDGDDELLRNSHDIALQLNAASDQHAALAEELDSLAAIAPCDFSPEHLFALVRAIRVQSRVLNMYLGPESVRC